MLKYIIAVILIIPVLLVMTPLMLIMAYKPNWFSLKFRYKYVRFIVKWASISLKVKYDIEGLENIPKEGSYLITPNHQSFFDSLALIAVIDKPIIFVAKKEVKKMPYIGLLVQVLGGFFLDRENIRESLNLMKRLENYVIENEGVGIVIFPEGTRTKDPKLTINEFKAGSYKVAYKAKIPVIPTVMNGTPKILSLKWYFIHHVNIRFGKMLNYDDYKDMESNELAEYCQNYSTSNLEELHKINDCRKYN